MHLIIYHLKWAPSQPSQAREFASPFGARKVTGVILDIVTETDVPPAKLRHADSVLDAAPLFSPELLALLRWAADYYQCPIG